MVTDMFSGLLQDVARAMQINELHPDRNNSCLINLGNDTKVQLELDKGHEFLIIGFDIGNVPAGRYRENVFREAMKANGLPHPRYGTFAYSKQADKLVLFEKISLTDINGERVASMIRPMSDKAKIWKESVAHGEIPTVSSVHTGRVGMFGLRP